jgi:hypothetical protein
MAQTPSHSRNVSHNTTKSFWTTSGTEDPTSRNLRPLPASRDGSPGGSHHRVLSRELHAVVGQHPRPVSMGAAPADFGQLPIANNINLAGMHAAYDGQNETYAGNAAYRSSIGQSPARISTFGPRTTIPLTMEEGELLPPPPIGDASGKRNYSPAGSRSGSRTRGRSGSRGGEYLSDSRGQSPGSDGQRPATPTDGKLKKKPSWLPGKSHDRSASGSEATPKACWAITSKGAAPYESSYLLKAQPVSFWRAAFLNETDDQRFRNCGTPMATYWCTYSPGTRASVHPSRSILPLSAHRGS